MVYPDACKGNNLAFFIVAFLLRSCPMPACRVGRSHTHTYGYP